MAIKQSLQLLAISVGFVALTACSSTGTGANATGGANGADNSTTSGVVTAGVGNDNSGGGLSNPNAMVPGANQKYYFDFDKSDVHASDLPSIKVQAQYLISHPSASALLAGNTDIRGSREYNIALGQRRANAVKNALTLQGVSNSQLRTISYGAEKPVALGNTETDYAQNRRVDLMYEVH